MFFNTLTFTIEAAFPKQGVMEFSDHGALDGFSGGDVNWQIRHVKEEQDFKALRETSCKNIAALDVSADLVVQRQDLVNWRGPVGKDANGKGAGKASDWNCPKCGDLVFGRNNACRQCGAERPGGPVAQGPDHENTVFMRGLSWSVTEENLRKDFAECGDIESLRMPMNGEGRPKGIAFIKFVAPEGVIAALKFDETDYGGRIINVCKSGEVQPKGKGKDGTGKSKGKDKGKDGKGKGKGKSKAPTESFAKYSGCIVASTAAVKTFEDSDGE